MARPLVDWLIHPLAMMLRVDSAHIEGQWRKAKKLSTAVGQRGNYLLALKFLCNSLGIEGGSALDAVVGGDIAVGDVRGKLKEVSPRYVVITTQAGDIMCPLILFVFSA